MGSGEVGHTSGWLKTWEKVNMLSRRVILIGLVAGTHSVVGMLGQGLYREESTSVISMRDMVGEMGERKCIEWEGGSDRTGGEEPRFVYIQLPASGDVEGGSVVRRRVNGMDVLIVSAKNRARWWEREVGVGSGGEKRRQEGGNRGEQGSVQRDTVVLSSQCVPLHEGGFRAITPIVEGSGKVMGVNGSDRGTHDGSLFQRTR